MAAALLVAQGLPMIHMGDEYGHTKRGNNNTYCHDDDLSWFDWEICDRDSDGLVRFFSQMIKLRKECPVLGVPQYLGSDRLQWHGNLPDQPDWSDQSRLVAFSVHDPTRTTGLYVVFNSAHTPTVVQLPKWEGFQWRPLVDTAKPAPLDFLVADDELSSAEVEAAIAAQSGWLAVGSVPVMAWSCVILQAVYEVDMPDYSQRFASQKGKAKDRGTGGAFGFAVNENKKMWPDPVPPTPDEGAEVGEELAGEQAAAAE